MKDFDIHEQVHKATAEAMAAIDPEGISAQVHRAVEEGLEGVRAAVEGIAAFEQEGDDEPGSDVSEMQFTVGPRPELSVGNISGRVSIRAVDESVIRVRAAKVGRQRRRENTRIEYSQDGDQVSIHTKARPASGWLNLSPNMSSVDYEITVPRRCLVEVNTVSADVDVHGTQERVKLQTVSGDVLAEDVAGDCRISTVSGDVVGTRLGGSLNLRTTSGDAIVRESRLQGFNLHSVSGDFQIETPLTSTLRYYANTTSGDLRLFVPASTGATVTMKSVSGTVHSELPADIIRSGRRSWQGRINGGGANVEMSSVSGDLRIAESGQMVSDIPVAPAEQSRASSGETVDILAALQRGEISVEEAMARLDAAGGER